ncbi:Anion permease ArsB/NhaD-like [Thermococcus sp. 2319x1]|uniref:SLC13 family permease n=1 Tax=Thermococcus sp. 2319x1 TaxID=1674923 RepID=UPI00073A7169|nr:SLC13 family permease [Thermococcus sp. 2319x1]ALV63505.1 Anion permease ArsB/NhaD-like [Thermococcus sp. 2319x1]
MGKLTEVIKREWFLSLLVALYAILSIVDHSLLSNTPRFIDWRSLAFITALFLTSKAIELSGAFEWASLKALKLSGGSERRLLMVFIPVIATSSAIIMNDTAMFVFVPIVAMTARLSGVSVAKATALSAIAANVGSSLTPIGNPQNVIIWQAYRLGFFEFVFSMAPFVVFWLVLLLPYVLIVKKRPFETRKELTMHVDKPLLVVSVGLLALNVLLAELHLQYAGLALTLLILFLFGRRAFFNFDWALILTFALIFVDFRELSILLSESGLSFPRGGIELMLLSAGISQVISNVPATVLLLPQEPEWLSLALGVNLGGNGVIVGSLANLIAVRIAGVSIRDFQKYSLPYFLLSTVATVLVLSFLRS